MKQLNSILIFLLISISWVQAQKISIQECFEKAQNTHVYGARDTINLEIQDLQLQIAQSNWFPNLSLQAQATWQSEVMSIDLPSNLPINIDSPNKDQYKAVLEINQLIYDGGRIKAQKELVKAQTNNELQKNKLDKYETYKNVSDAFFQALIIQQTREQLRATIAEIQSQRSSLQVAVENGVQLESNLYSLDAELLKLEQKEIELEALQMLSKKLLSRLIHEELSDSIELLLPELIAVKDESFTRPEFGLFKEQILSLKAKEDLTSTQRMPQLYAFGQAGYGKPGLNFMKNEMDSWFLIGIGLKWTLYDWNRTRNEKNIYRLQQQVIQTQESKLKESIYMGLDKESAQVQSMKNALERDDQIIALRKKVLEAAKIRLDNGSITSTQYLTEQTAYSNALIDKEVHELKLRQAYYNSKILRGF